eukprot:CAMPEP_0115123638 /NCGR_PEP_ID=MMETSP0227-20121206/47678_1 /TAXON_ID=89957 /ORGANISM="Polarella glacialis, Strain CCMP 1383" /LENGTH=298 /DNA_ID=CAMNT_0002526081 /DNA_START=81 /DNA_END=977 /DNA_ORIENTATION=+
MILFLVMLSLATPGIETYLEKCDPVQCASISSNLSPQESQNKVVDCLAAGTWEGYQKRYDGPSYPSYCPKIMLKCNGDSVEHLEPELKDPRMEASQELLPVIPQGSARSSGSSLRRLGVGRQEFFPAQAAANHLAARSRSWRVLPRLDGNPGEEEVGKMPADPIASCKPKEKGMKIIHQARLLLPELVPKLVVFISVKLLLLIPVILLGCVGFCWGKDLFARLGQGYGQLGGSMQLVHHNVAEAVLQQPFAFNPVAPNSRMPAMVPTHQVTAPSDLEMPGSSSLPCYPSAPVATAAQE